MKETQIQKEYAMEFICRREDEGGLGYRNTSANLVNNDLIIPSVLAEFVSKSEPKVWKNLLKQYHNDEYELQMALKDEVAKRMIESQNVAIFINKNRTINFGGESVPLFYVSGTELKGDEDFNKNIFSVVEESSHKFEIKDEKLDKMLKISQNLRPDISFFINGIYFGYMELKSVSQGQNAEKNGQRKIAKDYLCTVQGLADMIKVNQKAAKERRRIMSVYEKAIHLTSSDFNETYVLRGIQQFYDTANQEFMKDSPCDVETLTLDIMKVFKPYPVSSELLSQKERFEEVMRALYSKKMVENEIRYYNFMEYNYVRKDGIKDRTSNTGRLIAPRPKQKFGCDKIMARITEMLDHEGEPNYYNDKLRRELVALGISAKKIEEIILQREQFCNNKYVYSLLMQYAAGFGKSNIIGWTALRLKDYRYKGEYAYDKIMLVVDRLQLRDQLDTTMMNMNIDKSMFVEATDKDTFIKALDDQKRIIVVNIQKFLDLQNAISESGKKLRQMRVAFLIDEIHRSNSGENNKEMINLFARLQETFNNQGKTILKKNLLIGFTATPSDETLTRFGEFKSATIIPFWVPFDSYTMKDAINDGYILDPTKHIIPYSVPVVFDLPDELQNIDEDTVDIRQNKDAVYSFEPRIMKISKFVVDRLVSLVYGRICGEGKAMLAVSSIPNAIKYYKIIKKLYEEKCKEKIYSKYKDAPICIVYSNNQKNQSSAELNGGMSEADVIQNFKKAKNGLMIVVDKLQTGFDEPKLHTLFLDKEISGINAIQTISRVNRICKIKKVEKTECHVIDCSWQNVNVGNINQAFRKFCEMVISNFNPEEEARELGYMYKELCSSDPYINWFARFQREHNDVNFVLEMEDGIRQWIAQCFNEEEAAKEFNAKEKLKAGDARYIPEINKARDIRQTVSHYGVTLQSLRDIYVIDPKYLEELFLEFWHIYCNIYKDVTRKHNVDETYEYVVIESGEEPGITLAEDDGIDKPEGPKRGKGKSEPKKPKGKSMEDILEILRKLNENEQLSAEQAKVWMKEIGLMFDWMRTDRQLVAYVLDDKYLEDEKLKRYKKSQGKYKLLMLKEDERPDFKGLGRFKQLLNDNEEQLYALFAADLRNVENNDSDFDYDLTTVAGGDVKIGDNDFEKLSELIKKKLKPDYNEAALKEALVAKYAVRLEDVAYGMRPISEVVDNLFMVLNTPTTEQLDGIDGMIKESLNMTTMAEGMTMNEKRTHFDVLLMRYEGFLKKLYYLINGKEVENREQDKTATLTDAIFGIPSLRNLKYNPREEYKEFDERLGLLRRLRNDEAHGGSKATEQEIDMMTMIVVDMYLFVVGTNITELEMAEDAEAVLGVGNAKTRYYMRWGK